MLSKTIDPGWPGRSYWARALAFPYALLVVLGPLACSSTGGAGHASDAKETSKSLDAKVPSSSGADSCLEWQQVYGGAAHEGGQAVAALPDGGWAIFGDTEGKGEGGTDFWLIRTDRAGTALWDTTFGSSGNEYAKAFAALPDGRFILAGDRWGDDITMLIEGVSAEGHGIWEVQSPQWMLDYNYAMAYGALNTDSGRVVIAGRTGLDPTSMLLAKSKSFDTFTTQVIEGYDGASARALAAMPEDGLLVAGTRGVDAGIGAENLWVLRLDKAGSIVWEAKSAGEMNTEVSAVSFSDGSSIVGGRGHTGGGYRLLRLDAAGKTLWEKRYDGFGEKDYFSLATLGDSSVILVGNVAVKGTLAEDAWVRYINLDGEQTGEWTGGGPGRDLPTAVAVAADGRLGITGLTSTSTTDLTDSDVWMLVLDPSGTHCGGK